MARKRRALSKRVRFEVFKRDRFQCQYCGQMPPAVVLHVDHIVPVAEGGGNEEPNLLTACEACNLGKGAVPLERIPDSAAAQAKRLTERREQLAAFNAILMEEREEERELLDHLSGYWLEMEGRPGRVFVAGNDWWVGLKTFTKHLPQVEIMDFMERAHPHEEWEEERRWRYFCKCCWNTIREREGGRR